MNLGGLDVAVLAGYFAAILAVGFWFGRRERNTHDYFLGGRRQHWLIVGLSIVATEVSALTFLAVPGRSYETNWWYLQLYVGSIIGRVLIVVLLLPAFYRGNVTTVYEYLGRRFGPGTRTTASLMFFASRIVGSGIRLLAASLALAIVFDWPVTWVVIGAAAIAIAYTTYGGIKAIIWTDALQALVFLGGAIAAVAFLFLAIPGSWSENLSVAYHSDKLKTITWGTNPNDTTIFWVLVIHATFQTMAALGTDQDLTQRMLTCPDVRRGQRSLIFNTILGLPVVCLFLLIGTLLHVYYSSNPATPVPIGDQANPDRIFPYFIGSALPLGSGLRGLLVAGIFAAAMSSLDSALGALSSCAVTDFYRPWKAARRRRSTRLACREPATLATEGETSRDDAGELRIARVCTFFFGILIAAVALAFTDSEGLLEDAFGWVGLIFGGMLGVFILGVTTKRRGHDLANVIAMLSSVAILATIKYLQEQADTVYVAWPWWVVIGTIWTCALGLCFRTTRRSA